MEEKYRNNEAVHSVSSAGRPYPGNHESSRRRAAKKKKRNQIIAICIFSVLILALFTGVIITDYSGIFVQSEKNSFRFNISGNKMIYHGENVKEIRIQYGESAIDFSATAQDIIPLDQDMQSYTLQYNGHYVVRIQYKDDAETCEFVDFIITDNDEPMSIVSGNNTISFTRNPNFKITSISYIKGITLGDPNAGYITDVEIPAPDDTGSIEVSEKGYYTFKITAEKTINGKTTSGTFYSATRVR